MGTSFEALDLAEDRGRFSKMLEANNIPFPQYGIVQNAEQALELSDELGFLYWFAFLCFGWSKNENCYQ
jgi:Carbamoylphosphate synthase large subunit (split gene in MJ)